MDAPVGTACGTGGGTVLTVTYETTITAVCPVDATVTDIYELTITTDGWFLPVEEILEAIAAVTITPIFQESLTQLLRDRLVIEDKEIKVTSSGVHSGVKVTATA